MHISCDMYLRLGLHLQIRLYYVLPYKAKISAQHSISFILDRCIVYLGLTMPNLQKKRQPIFEIFNIIKCIFFFGTEYMNPCGSRLSHEIKWAFDKKRIMKFNVRFDAGQPVPSRLARVELQMYFRTFSHRNAHVESIYLKNNVLLLLTKRHPVGFYIARMR